jgi:hypothetical protein
VIGSKLFAVLPPFHPAGRYGPEPSLEIELGPFGESQLTWALKHSVSVGAIAFATRPCFFVWGYKSKPPRWVPPEVPPNTPGFGRTIIDEFGNEKPR